MKRPKVSLRDLMWLIALIGVGLGWWTERRHLLATIGRLSAEFMQGELRPDDLAQISALVAAETSEPILSIRLTGKGTAEVETGFINGPLNGGGNSFELEKHGDKWQLLNHSMWVS
jgi:hypothetical protein